MKLVPCKVGIGPKRRNPPGEEDPAGFATMFRQREEDIAGTTARSWEEEYNLADGWALHLRASMITR